MKLHSQGSTIAAYISLGSNQAGAYGSPTNMLEQALQDIACFENIQSLSCSPVYMTSPQGAVQNQAWFYNQVAALHCTATYTPEALLDELLKLEYTLGRTREIQQPPGSARCIDLDLLLFGNEVRTGKKEEGGLILPHPRMQIRAFVLVPLHDLAPEFIFPDGKPLKTALQELSYTAEANCITQG